MLLYKPQKIYVEEKAKFYPLTSKILSRCQGTPVEVIDNVRSLIRNLHKRPDPIGEGKRYLFLAYDKGRSFKPFPESEAYLSCDYYTLHVAEGCDLECSYCILQAYLTNPLLTVFVNIEETLEKLQTILDQNRHQFFRIGTGQLADSLSLDHLTGFSEILVPFFARQQNAVLELKTKSTHTARLLELDPQGSTIVSWSMNSRKVQKEEEHKCAAIEDRISAAREVITRGYRVGFHFDPIIDYDHWEGDYAQVIDEIFALIPSEKIAWISLGCLRMMKELKPIMQNRFPKSELALAEWIKGMDGKLRYFKPRRIEIYKKVVDLIRCRSENTTLYLCMETPEVWQHVLGMQATKESVCAMLDRAGMRNHAPSPILSY